MAKLPLAKDIDGFDFAGTPINDALVRNRATGGFVADQRNVVLIGDEPLCAIGSSTMASGTGKTHLAIARALAIVLGPMADNGSLRGGTRGRFFNVVDLVNRLETEARAGKQGRLADDLARLDLFAIGLEPVATRWLTPR